MDINNEQDGLRVWARKRNELDRVVSDIQNGFRHSDGRDMCRWLLKNLIAKEIRPLQDRIDKVINILRPQTKWIGPEPAEQGQPDGETWAHYCHVLEARELIEILEGNEE